MSEKGEFNKLGLPQEISDNMRKFIKNYLKEKDLNVYSLGEEIGGSSELFRGILQNNTGVRMDTYVKISQHSGVSIDEIIGRKKKSKEKVDSPLSRKLGVQEEELELVQRSLEGNIKHILPNKDSPDKNKDNNSKKHVELLINRSKKRSLGSKGR